jgi:hypothetical protein
LYFIKLWQSYTNAAIPTPVAKKSALFLDKNNIGVGSLAATPVFISRNQYHPQQ